MTLQCLTELKVLPEQDGPVKSSTFLLSFLVVFSLIHCFAQTLKNLWHILAYGVKFYRSIQGKHTIVCNGSTTPCAKYPWNTTLDGKL